MSSQKVPALTQHKGATLEHPEPSILERKASLRDSGANLVVGWEGL